MSLETQKNQTLRYSLEDPSYRYPPSHNPYWKRIREETGIAFSDNDTETHSSQWKSQFPCSKSSEETSHSELHVEVGCNAGHVIVEWATANPNQKYIGIDWKFKGIHRAAEKAQKRELKNLLLLRAHAQRLHYMFGPEEIDFLYLYFPDPWPKKSHWKNRLINEKRLRLFAELVKPGGVFHIKTDHRGYFDWMLEAIEKTGDVWKPFELTFDLHKGNPNAHLLQFPEVTLFEKLFIKDQLPIHSVKLEKIRKPN